VAGRALLAGAALLLVLVGSCAERSNLDRDVAVTVRGTVHDVDGEPLAARPVRLGSGVSDLEGATGALTVGLFCLSGECAGDSFDDRSGEDGSFSFELTGADAQSTFGEAVSFLLSTSGEPRGKHPTGPAVSARFRIQTADLALPTLRLVDPGLRLAADGPAVTASWEADAPAPYTVSYATRDSEPVWEASVAAPAASADGRVLEDVTGLATVGGSRTDAVDGSDLTVSWRSSGVAFRGGFGAPASRGAPCDVRSSAGLATEIAGCPLTDGAFRRSAIPQSVCPEPAGEGTTTSCAPAEGIRVHLPTAVPADLLVVRGCTAPCRAEVVTGDGAATDVGPVSGAFATVALAGAPVTAVDIITADVTSLVEVSVWAPARQQPALAPVEDEAVRGAPMGDTGRDPRLVAAAIVLLLGALAFAIRARRLLSTG
jgi:hypothetical protein